MRDIYIYIYIYIYLRGVFIEVIECQRMGMVVRHSERKCGFFVKKRVHLQVGDDIGEHVGLAAPSPWKKSFVNPLLHIGHYSVRRTKISILK